jgi:predicted nucleic acid-binding protein
MTFVVDASVFVSFLVPQDILHEPSRTWFRRRLTDGAPLIAPIILLTEVGGAIAWRTNLPELGHRAVAQLQRLSVLRLVPIDHRLGLSATDLAINLRLRGADAIYVSVAAQLGIPLVSWDKEHLDRAGAHITVQTP